VVIIVNKVDRSLKERARMMDLPFHSSFEPFVCLNSRINTVYDRSKSGWVRYLLVPFFFAAFLLMNLNLCCSPLQNMGFLKTSISLSCFTLWKSYMLSFLPKIVPESSLGYLSHKGWKIGVSEIFGKDLSGKADYVEHDKSHIIFVPTYDFPILGVLY